MIDRCNSLTVSVKEKVCPEKYNIFFSSKFHIISVTKLYEVIRDIIIICMYIDYVKPSL